MENSNLLACVEQELRRSTYRRGRPPCLPVFRGLFAAWGWRVPCSVAGRHGGLPLRVGRDFHPLFLRMIQQMAQNRPARPASHSPGRRPGRWGDTKGNCALQGQNRQTCPKGIALAGRRWAVAYLPRAFFLRFATRSNLFAFVTAWRKKASPSSPSGPGLGDAAPAGRLCARSARRDACVE